MNSKRATEISNSPEMIEVTYQGDPVYIEFVNNTKETASIHRLSQPQNSQEVSVSQLQEIK